MVVIKQLDGARLGYEIQKGLTVDMPGGDGKAIITESEDAVTLSEKDGKYCMTLKNVQLSDFVDHDVRIVLKYGPNTNHLTLEDVVIDAPTSKLVSYEGDNRMSDTILSGHNLIEMTGQRITDSFIKDSQLDQATINNSAIKRSRLELSHVDDSYVVNSDLINTVVRKNSLVELSELTSDTVTRATVAGIGSNWHDWAIDERTFDNGYFVGNGDNGYVQVADETTYTDALAQLVLNRELPCAWDRETYRPNDSLKEWLMDGWMSVPDIYRDETLELAPFLKEVIQSDTAAMDAFDFSQFEVTSQHGLQQ